MHDLPPASQANDPLDDGRPWYKLLTRYHWFVLIVAVLGWSFDTMDQQLFSLARRPAMLELVGPIESSGFPTIEDSARWFGDISTSIFLIGWATGGLIFGVLGDKFGRARTMMLTILLYSIFTGLSAFSRGVWDFMAYRFLTGLGVGGEFAVGVALVAEVIPDRARPHALGWVQAFSAVGNITAALLTAGLGQIEGDDGTIFFGLSTWRVFFLVGAVPALLAVVVRAGLKEPERWKSVAGTGEADDLPSSSRTARLGSLAELFGDPTLRRNTIVGMLLAFSGVVGLWGIGFFSYELLGDAFTGYAEAAGVPPERIASRVTTYKGIASLFQNLGGFLGIWAFTRFAQVTGRRPAFAVGLVLAMFSTAFTFWYVGRIGGLYSTYAMLFTMGFCQLTLFGGYAIYFPELFPTRLRSTGTSFCYNVGRLVAAVGPLFLGVLTGVVYKDFTAGGADMPRRYACVTMCSIFLVGLAALPFAPETKGKPLPD